MIAAELVNRGASPPEAYRRMFGNIELAKRRLTGRLLERVVSRAGGRVLATRQDLADKRDLGVKSRGSDDVYQLLGTVAGCEVVVLVREERKGFCSASLRSDGSIDVVAIAKSFGGGGHPGAAGCALDGSTEEVLDTVLSAVESALVMDSPTPGKPDRATPERSS